MNKNKRSLRKFIQLTIYILVLFFLQEMFFRFSFPLPEIKNLDRIYYLNWHPDVDREGQLRDQNWYWESTPDTVAIFKHYMNRYGYRDCEWSTKRTKGKKRAIFIGDSFVEGLMANQEETIPEGFKIASSNQNFEVMNAGMMGMGLNSYLQLLADIIPIYKPDVIFFCIYANDLGQKKVMAPELYLEPDYYKWYIPRLMELIIQLRTNGPVLFRWDNRFEPFLQTSQSKSNPWAEEEERLKPHVSKKLADAMKNGHFNPYRTNSLIHEERNLRKIPSIGETIPFIKFFSDKFNVEPIVIYIPGRNQVTNQYIKYEKELCKVEYHDSIDLTRPEYQIHQQIVAKQCSDFNIQFIDLTQVVKEKEARGEHLYWNYDEHMRGKGYLFLGEFIWNQWQENRQ